MQSGGENTSKHSILISELSFMYRNGVAVRQQKDDLSSKSKTVLKGRNSIKFHIFTYQDFDLSKVMNLSDPHM